MLAVGSGATFTSAAFASSTTPTADLRVVVDQDLTVEQGPGFSDGNPDNTDNSDFFTGANEDAGGDIDDSSGGAFENDSLPLAFVNGDTNDNLVIKAAVSNGGSHIFTELLQVSNDTSAPVNVGIAYDRGAGPGSDGSQYGQDISDDNVDLSGTSYSSANAEDFAQNVYQFRANQVNGSGVGGSDFANSTTPPSNVISPDPRVPGGTQGVSGSNSGIGKQADLPAGAVTIQPGEDLTLDLVVDTSASDAIEAAAQGSNTFGKTTSTVDILDEITVGTFDSPSETIGNI